MDTSAFHDYVVEATRNADVALKVDGSVLVQANWDDLPAPTVAPPDGTVGMRFGAVAAVTEWKQISYSMDCKGTPQQAVPWDSGCNPGTCPTITDPTLARAPIACFPCQVDIYRKYCGQPANFFVEYFGPAGPFSPLPPSGAYLLAFADATGGSFTYVGDDLLTVDHIPGDVPPIAHPGDFLQPEECTSQAGASVLLSGLATDEKPMGDLEFIWRGPFVEGNGVVRGQMAPVTLPVGTNAVQLIVFDGRQSSMPAGVSVEVVDRRPPTLQNFAYTGPPCLWPPNHQWVALRVGRDFQAAVRDICDPKPRLEVISVTNSQPQNVVGDGATGTDVAVFPDRVCLRAERQGPDQSDRLYRIRLAGRDSSGNQSMCNHFRP